MTQRTRPGSAEALAPTNLTTDLQPRPMAVENLDDPKLSWTVYGDTQDAYEVRLSMVSGGQRGPDAEVWNSGRVIGSESSGVPYGGPRLSTTSRYRWSVRTWEDGSTTPSPWSEPAEFGTALHDDWQAVPIWASDAADAPWIFCRRAFTLNDREISAATLFMTASSGARSRQYVARMNVNGQEIAVGPVSHGARAADSPYYLAADVTADLRLDEENTLSALAYTVDDQRLVAQLVIDYADGGRHVVGTDASWKVLSGDGIFSSLGNSGSTYYEAPQERVDSRAYPVGYSDAGFDDSRWPQATEKHPFRSPVAQQQQNVKVEHHAPQSIRNVGGDPTHYIVDFGRAWVGSLSLHIPDGADGQVVDVYSGEMMNGADAVRWETQAGNHYRDQFILAQGEQTLSIWGYRVFRYVELVGAPAGLSEDDIRARAFVYPFDPSQAAFHSSHADLDRVWNFTRGSVERLRFDLYYDSPTRERTADNAGDTYVISRASAALSSDHSSNRFSIDYAAQNRSTLTEWRLAEVVAMRDDWYETGDDSLIRARYRYLQEHFLPEQFISQDGLVEKPVNLIESGAGDWKDVIDWPPDLSKHGLGVGERDGYEFSSVITVVNAWAFAAYRAMAEIAAHLGESADAERYAARAAAIRDAVNAQLWDEQKGAYRDAVGIDHYAVHATLYPLAFGITDKSQESAAAAYLLDRGLRCSVFAANFYLQGLGRAGRAADVVKVLSSTGQRSWNNMIDIGAGAIMESWDPSVKWNTTYSHLWAAAPVISVGRDLFGIAPTAPGYASFDVRPQCGELEHASVTIPTVRGQIAVGFETTESGATRWQITVPGNARARIYIPSNNAESLEEVPQLGREDGSTAFEVSAGTWTFVS